MEIRRIEGQQLLSESLTGYGIPLREALEDRGITKILEGMVMVARFNNVVHYLFEVGATMNVKALKEATFMYPLAGSKLLLRDYHFSSPYVVEKIFSKTLLFRDCRLPNIEEYELYKKSNTI